MSRTYIGALRGSMSMSTAEWRQNFDRAKKNVDNFSKSIEQKARRIEKAGKRMEKFGKSMMKNVTAPLLAAGAAAVALAGSTAKYAVEVDNISRRTRFATDTTQQWMYVTDQLNTSMDAVERTGKAFVSRIGQIERGSGEAAEAFEALGLSLYTSDGQLRQTEDLYFDIVRALSGVENETQRNVYANALFGRSFAEMNNILDAGQDEITRLMDRSKELNLVMSGESIEAAKEYSDMMGELKMQFGALTREIGMEFIPILKQDLIPYVQDTVIPAMRKKVDQLKDMIQKYKDLPEPIKAITGKLVKLMAVLGPVSYTLGKFAKVLSSVYKAGAWLTGTTAGLATSVAGLTAGLGVLAVVERNHLENLGKLTGAQKQLNEAMAEQDIEALQSLYDDLTAKYNENSQVLERLKDNYERGGGEAGHLKTRINSLTKSQAELLEQLSLVSKSIKFVTSMKNIDAVATDNLTEATDRSIDSQREAMRAISSMTVGSMELLDVQRNVTTELEKQNYRLRETGHILGEWYGYMDGMISSYTDLEEASRRFGERMFNDSVVAGRGVKDLANNVVDAARQVISAKLYEAIANVLAASFAQFGWFGFAMASAGAAMVTGLFNSRIPSFSTGAIVYSPMMALVGDAPGPNNPEVVAPLQDLRRMMGGERTVIAGRWVISGNDLEFIQDRVRSKRSNTI